MILHSPTDVLQASIDRGDEELHSPTIPVSPLETVNQAGDVSQ